MATVIGKPKPVGRKFTVDIEVGAGDNPTHSYTMVTSKGTQVVSHNSVSLLAGSTPGVHWPISRYYIRRVRLMNKSKLLEPLRAAGFNIEPCYGSEKTTVVVEFPIALGENIRTQEEVGIWEKMHLTKFIQEHWADNQVSVTVDFDPVTEGPQIEQILQYFQYGLKSVSFLPRTNGVYPQMPYEPITKEKYEEIVASITQPNFENTRAADAEKEIDRFCDGDRCVIGTAPDLSSDSNVEANDATDATD